MHAGCLYTAFDLFRRWIGDAFGYLGQSGHIKVLAGRLAKL